MSQPRHQQGGGEGVSLGYEPGAPPEHVANAVFWSIATSALRICNLVRPALPGEFHINSELKLPGMPPRLAATNYDHMGHVSFTAGGKKQSAETGAAMHKEALADFILSEERVARRLPMEDDEVILGTWVLMGSKEVRAPDITWQNTKLNLHIFLHRSKRTEHRLAVADLTRVLPTGQVAVQKVAVRVQKSYSQTNISGPVNTAELGRPTAGRFVPGSQLTSLEIYDDTFRPKFPLGLLNIDQWQDVIEERFVSEDVLRLRPD